MDNNQQNTAAPANDFGMDFDGQTAALAALMNNQQQTNTTENQAAATETETNEAVAAAAAAEAAATAAATTTTETAATAATETTTETAQAQEWYKNKPATYPGEEPQAAATTQTAPAENPYKDLEPLLQDPEVKLILELKKAGKSIKDYAEQVKTIDFSKMTLEEMVKHELIKYEATPEEIQIELEKLEEMPQWKKNQELKDRRNALEAEQTARLAKFTTDIKQEYELSSKELEQYEAEAAKEREAIITDMVGKEYLGFIPGEREAKVLRYRYEYGFPELYQKKADGTPDFNRVDHKKFKDFVMRVDFTEAIVDSNISKAHKSGKETILDKVHNPSKGETGTAPATATDPTQAMQAVANDFFKPPF